MLCAARGRWSGTCSWHGCRGHRRTDPVTQVGQKAGGRADNSSAGPAPAAGRHRWGVPWRQRHEPSRGCIGTDAGLFRTDDRLAADTHAFQLAEGMASAWSPRDPTISASTATVTGLQQDTTADEPPGDPGDFDHQALYSGDAAIFLPRGYLFEFGQQCAQGNSPDVSLLDLDTQADATALISSERYPRNQNEFRKIRVLGEIADRSRT